MGIFDTLRDAFSEFVLGEDAPRERAVPRDLTEDDRLGWYDAGTERSKKAPRPSTIEDVQKLIKNRNPVRWYSLQSDFKWVQKEMRKLGLNPEDARYIL